MSVETKGRMIEFEVTEIRPRGPINENFSNTGALSTQIAKLDLNVVSEAVGAVIDQMGDVVTLHEGGPSQYELEFGVKITGEGNVIISKIGGEVSLKIKVTWNRS